MQFNPDGTLNPSGTDPILISNWTPLDASGNPNGAVGPLNVLSGGGLPVPQPPGSSNFELRLTDSTQFGREFALGSIEQDGYATGPPELIVEVASSSASIDLHAKRRDYEQAGV